MTIRISATTLTHLLLKRRSKKSIIVRHSMAFILRPIQTTATSVPSQAPKEPSAPITSGPSL